MQAGEEAVIEATSVSTERTQLKTLLGFKAMERSMDKLEQQTAELEKEKEQEALKLKEQAAQEAQMKVELDQTARAAMTARKLESKMIRLKTKAAENIFTRAQTDIKDKVLLAEDAAQKSSMLAKEIAEETDRMHEQLRGLQGNGQDHKMRSRRSQHKSHKLIQAETEQSTDGVKDHVDA